MQNLRETDWWWLLREIRQRRSLEPLQQRWILGEILKKPPVATLGHDQGARTGVHHLCYSRDWMMALWALKSFYWNSEVNYPLTVHFQTEMPQRALDAFRHHFPAARLIPIAEANRRVGAYFEENNLPYCRQLRPALGLHLKLFDFQILGEEPQLLAFDPDVLFFQKPAELVAMADGGVEGCWVQHDVTSCYGKFSEESIAKLLGVSLVPKVNTGIVLRPRNAFDYRLLEEWLKVPGIENPSSHAEQAWQAILASAGENVRFWPKSYVLSDYPIGDPANKICRHYAGGGKKLLVPEGVPLFKKSAAYRRHC